MALAIAVAAPPAFAGGGYGHGYGHRYGHGYGGHHGWTPRYRGHGHGGYDFGLGAVLGVLTGVTVAGALLAPRVYAAPAPVYYAAPPPPRRCYREDVYRYLPDGRIQWGVKTTCY